MEPASSNSILILPKPNSGKQGAPVAKVRNAFRISGVAPTMNSVMCSMMVFSASLISDGNINISLMSEPFISLVGTTSTSSYPDAVRKTEKKIIACSFFLQLYCGKEGKKVPCFHPGRGIPVVKNFLKACNKKLLHTHSLYWQNEKNQQWIYSNKTLFLLLSFSLLHVLPEQKPLEIEFWQSKDAISAGMASSSKHSATPLPNDWAL